MGWPIKEITATRNGRRLCMSKTQWCDYLDIGAQQLDRWLKKHHDSMQDVLDKEMSQHDRLSELRRRFTIGR